MDWYEAGRWLGAALIIAVFFLFPRWFSFRHRVTAGLILFPLGWIGVFSGLALGNRPFMQSEVVAWAWVGTSTMAIALGIILLVPALSEWRKRRRKPKLHKEVWPAGNRDG